MQLAQAYLRAKTGRRILTRGGGGGDARRWRCNRREKQARNNHQPRDGTKRPNHGNAFVCRTLATFGYSGEGHGDKGNYPAKGKEPTEKFRRDIR